MTLYLVVLVQDATWGLPIPGGDVEISDRPIRGGGDEIYAAKNIATNRLLEAATLNFQISGLWNVRTRVQKGYRQFVLDSTVEVKSEVSGR